MIVLRPLKNWVVYRLHVVEIAVLTTEIAHWQPNPFTHVQDKSVQEDEVCDSQHFVCRVKFNLLLKKIAMVDELVLVLRNFF